MFVIVVFLKIKIPALNPCTHRLCVSHFRLDVFNTCRFLSYHFCISFERWRASNANLNAPQATLGQLLATDGQLHSLSCLSEYLCHTPATQIGLLESLWTGRIQKLGKRVEVRFYSAKWECDLLLSLWLWLFKNIHEKKYTYMNVDTKHHLCCMWW